MNKKISQFEVANTINDHDILTIVQESTNKQVSKTTLTTSLSDTFATNERVDEVETSVNELDTKVDNNYSDLSNKITEGDATVKADVTSTVNGYYDVLNNKILTLEDKHNTDLNNINNSVQEWIDEIDDKSSNDDLHNALNKVTTLENLVTELANLIAEGGGEGAVPGFHTQSTATIFPLSGYYYTGESGDLTTTDTLNQALSKLEGKIKHIDASIGGDTKYMITSYDNTQPTDGNLYSAKRSDMNYISKKTDDTAVGYIKFLKGIQGGQTFREGFLGEGASLYPVNGRWKFECDDLFVRGNMTVNELIVNEIKATGGDILVSIADIEIIEVETTDSNDYKCFFDTQDGTKYNPFREGDQALCQIFDGKNVKRYWRMVSEAGNDYIVLSQSVCEPGSAIPEVGDKVIQLGNRYPEHTDRRSAIMISARGSEGPSITFYDNIDDFNLVGKERTRISKHSQFVGTLSQISSNGDIVRVPIDRGEYIPGTTYYYYDRVSYGGELWLCMATSTTNVPSKDNEEWLLQVAKGEQGAAGDDKAKWVEVVGERLFMYDNPNFTGTPKPEEITLACNTYNLENPTFEWINKYTNEVLGYNKSLNVKPVMFGEGNRNLLLRCTVTNDGETYYDETQLAKLGDGAQGEDAYYIDLSNSNMTVPYDASGNNPLISVSDVYTYVYAYKGTQPIAIESIKAIVSEGVAEVSVEGDKVTLVTLGSPSARITLNVVVDGMTLSKDLWINKVHNGEDGFDGVDAAYVMLTGEQVFKYDKEGGVSPTSITLTASTYNIESPVFTWSWSVAGENSWNTLENETNNTLIVSPDGIYFGTSVSEVTFKVEVTTAFGGGSLYIDMLTVNKLYDGKDGISPYRGALSNESHTVAATFNGIVDSDELAKAKTYYYLYQGTRKLEAAEYSITYTNVDNNSTNQLSHNEEEQSLTVAKLGNSYDSTVFKIEFRVPAGGEVVDVCDFTITKAKGGVPGDYEIILYCRSNESQPGAPSLTTRPSSSGEYSNGNYWYISAPAANGYAIWSSKALFDGATGRLKSGESWSLPVKISGVDGEQGPEGPQGPQGPAGADGATGNTGPGLNYRGEYNSSEYYYWTDDLRDVVSRNGTYYAVKYPGNVTPGWSSSDWKALSSFESVATKLLLAEEATIGGWQFSDNIDKYIKSLDDNVCLYGRDDSSVGYVVFAAGNGSTKGFNSSTKKINPSANLVITNYGAIYMGASNNSNCGMTGEDTSSSSVRIWAGASHDNRYSAPFNVKHNGSLTATNCTLTGSFETIASGNRVTINKNGAIQLKNSKNQLCAHLDFYTPDAADFQQGRIVLYVRSSSGTATSQVQLDGSGLSLGYYRDSNSTRITEKYMKFRTFPTQSNVSGYGKGAIYVDTTDGNRLKMKMS